MKDINNIQWSEFVLSDIFDITSTRSGIDKNKLVNMKGRIPYVTRSDKANGWESFVGQQNARYRMDNGNCISVGLDTQTAFYQSSPFYTGQNIQVLRNSRLNRHIALYIIPILKQLMTKFSWGGNGATLTRLKRSKIILPITSIGEPDYDFMEKYMRDLENRVIASYRNNISERTQEISSNKAPSLKEKRWNEYKISDIMQIKPGVRLTKSEMKRGDVPFIGASDSNNGITGFIANINSSMDHNVLGINYNGSVCETFYHPYKCLFSDDVKHLTLRNINGNKYLYLYIKQSIMQQRTKYKYGYKFNERRMTKQTVLLPSCENGQPDYLYMEQCMKAIELKQLTEYLKYLETKSIY